MIIDKIDGKYVLENRLNYGDCIIVKIYERKMMYFFFYLRRSYVFCVVFGCVLGLWFRDV